MWIYSCGLTESSRCPYQMIFEIKSKIGFKMAIKILATGDLHLGKKSSSVPESAEEGSSKFTWNRIIDLSIRNGIDILALTGDIVDQDNRYFEAIGPLQTGFKK